LNYCLLSKVANFKDKKSSENKRERERERWRVRVKGVRNEIKRGIKED
jgi:hypothetical protein